MAPVPISSRPADLSPRAARASLSLLSSLVQHQTQGRRADAFGPAAANDQSQDWPGNRAGITFLTLQNTDGVSSAVPFHSRSARVLPLRLSRKRVCLVPPGHTRAYSLNVPGSTPSRSKALQHEPLVGFTSPAAGLIHHNRLPKLSFRPDHHGRSEKGWRYQIPVMRCPK